MSSNSARGELDETELATYITTRLNTTFNVLSIRNYPKTLHRGQNGHRALLLQANNNSY